VCRFAESDVRQAETTSRHRGLVEGTKVSVASPKGRVNPEVLRISKAVAIPFPVETLSIEVLS
jgi:hypothetical protein